MMIFEEKQRMSQLWWLLISFVCPPLVLLLVRVYVPAIEKEELLQDFIILCVMETVLFILMFSMVLRTTIDSNGVLVSYRPFIRKRLFSWSDIDTAFVRKYKPITEYGGWGYKGGMKSGMAYNVWGNMGLQLHLKTGKKLLIGTQKATQMNDFLMRLKDQYQIASIQEANITATNK